MLFNPLFLQVINNQEPVSTKTQKLSNSSYLFSDIIKVSVENEMQNSGSLGLGKTVNSGDSGTDFIGKQIVNIPLELKSGNNTASVESVLEQLISQLTSSKSTEGTQKSGLNEDVIKSIDTNGTNGDKQYFDQSKICELISKLVNNSEFNGKANLVIDRQKLLQDNYSSELDEITKNEITPETLLNLLKMGNTISLENSPAEKNLGLLITLIEHSDESTPGTESKETDGSIDLGVKNIFKKDKEFNLSSLLGNSQNGGNIDTTLYEIKISVIDQSANINQNDNFAAQGLEISGEPENKIKVDIVLKDSAADAKNDLAILSKMAPPEELFASTSVNTGELSKVSSSFSNSLNADAQQLKNITKTSPEILNNVTSAETNADVLTDNVKVNTENISGTNPGNPNQKITGETVPENISKQNIKQSTDNTLSKELNPANTGKQQTQQNNILGMNAEEASAFAKISGSIKSQFFKSAESGKAVNTGKVQDQKNVVEKNILGKSETASTGKPNIKVDTQNENTEISGIKPQEIKAEGSGKETSAQTIVEKDSEKINPGVINGKQIIQEKADAEKTQTLNKEVNAEDKDVKQKLNVVDESKEKISAETKSNNSNAVKESIKANTQPASSVTASQASKTESQDAQVKNTDSTKPEINENTKANPAVAENKNAEEKNQEKTLSDGNKNPEENKKAHDGKILNETNFDKTLDTVAKDKAAGLEKGHYADAARTVKAAEIAKEMSRHIQSRENGTLYLKIDPEHLGTVKIAVEVVDKMIRANIEVENESARKLIENNLNQLQNNLNQNGIQLNSLNISLSNFEQKQGKAFNSKRKSSGYGEDGDSTENTSANKEKTLGYNTYEYTV